MPAKSFNCKPNRTSAKKDRAASSFRHETDWNVNTHLFAAYEVDLETKIYLRGADEVFFEYNHGRAVSLHHLLLLL